jgi:hypothetical protein
MHGDCIEDRKEVSLKIEVKMVYRLQNIVIIIQFINYCRLLQTAITRYGH